MTADKFRNKNWYLGGADAPPFPNRKDQPIYHPACQLFPTMNAEELKILTHSIVTDGLQEPIVVDELDRIIDGRNRYNNYARQGKKIADLKKLKTIDGGPAVVVFKGTDAEVLSFVMRKNLQRRHLTSEQKMVLHGKIRKLFGFAKSGGQKKTSPTNVGLKPGKAPTAKALAASLGVNTRTVERADAKLKGKPTKASVIATEVKKPKVDTSQKSLFVSICRAVGVDVAQTWLNEIKGTKK